MIRNRYIQRRHLAQTAQAEIQEDRSPPPANGHEVTGPSKQIKQKVEDKLGKRTTNNDN